MLGLGLKLLGLGEWLKEAARQALQLTCKYPLQVALVASLAISCWLWNGRQEARANAAKWETAFSDQKLAYERASKEAAALAIAQVKAVESKSAQIAKDNANEERALRAELGARAAANADRMRADKYCSRLAATAPQDNPAPVDPGPGADAVILSRPDYDLMVENTIRLKAVHAWGQDALRDGLAKVPVDWPAPDLSVQP